MTRRVCSESGCPTIIATGSRCTTHERARDRARGTRQERGYDRIYDAARRSYEVREQAGEVFTCWRCLLPIVGPWQLGHCDNDRAVIHGPEHPGCNLATSGRTTCTHISHVT